MANHGGTRVVDGGELPPRPGDDFKKWETVCNMILNTTNTGINLSDRLRHDPNADKTLKEIQSLVGAVCVNNTQMRSLVDVISNGAGSQAQMLEAQLGQIMNPLQGMEGRAQSTNEMLQSIADGIKSFSKPSVMGLIPSIGGLLIGMAAVAEIRRLADNTEKMAGSLNGIDQNLNSLNSRGDYFPQHVHSYIRTMIERHNQDEVPHYFFVFHQGHEWHPRFEDLQRKDPLGPRFVGYRDDLDELCAFLVDKVRPRVGKEAVLHILMPTVKPLAITESLTFPDAMRPFCIEGQKGDGGNPYVFMCTPRPEDRECLKYIGALRPKPRWVLLQQVGLCLPFIGEYTSIALEPRFFEDPYWSIPTESDLFLYASQYFPCDPVPPRILGEPRAVRA